MVNYHNNKGVCHMTSQYTKAGKLELIMRCQRMEDTHEYVTKIHEYQQTPHRKVWAVAMKLKPSEHPSSS